MKVGLITVFFADYGSYFQTVSLYKMITSLGYDCEVVNESLRYPHSFRLFAGSVASRIAPKFFKRYFHDRVAAFRTYETLKAEVSQINVGKSFINSRKALNKYDCVVIGSDELWSITNKNIKFIPQYFGIGFDKPHISYGTSGITLKDPPEKSLKLMSQGIKSFSDVAVRDVVTKDWVDGLCGINSTIVFDPTLLNPFFGSEGIGGGGYLLVYGEHFTDEHSRAVRKYADAMGYEIKSVAWKQPWCDSFADIRSASELQDLFRRAEYCAASSYHGVIFSMLNHRNFTAFLTEFRASKVDCLLKEMGLTDRKFNGEIIDTPVDYNTLDSLIAIKRNASLEYLKSALKKLEDQCDAV